MALGGLEGSSAKTSGKEIFCKKKQKKKTEVGREGHQILDIGIFPFFLKDLYDTK